MTGPVEWLERRLALAEGYAQEAARRFPGACWPSDAGVIAYGAMGYAEEVAAPENMLRLVVGARQILAVHKLVKTTGYDAYGAAVFDACQLCGRGGYTPGPCRTVRLLAQAWGWEEEAS